LFSKSQIEKVLSTHFNFELRFSCPTFKVQACRKIFAYPKLCLECAKSWGKILHQLCANSLFCHIISSIFMWVYWKKKKEKKWLLHVETRKVGRCSKRFFVNWIRPQLTSQECREVKCGNSRHFRTSINFHHGVGKKPLFDVQLQFFTKTSFFYCWLLKKRTIGLKNKFTIWMQGKCSLLIEFQTFIPIFLWCWEEVEGWEGGRPTMVDLQ